MRARGLAVTIATYFAFAALYVNVASTALAHIGAYFNYRRQLRYANH